MTIFINIASKCLKTVNNDTITRKVKINLSKEFLKKILILIIANIPTRIKKYICKFQNIDIPGNGNNRSSFIPIKVQINIAIINSRFFIIKLIAL